MADTYDRLAGEIHILSRFPGEGPAYDYDVQAITTPASLLTFIDRPVFGPITPEVMSDYLVEAFDRGFCSVFGIDNATYAWVLPDNEVVYQHST
jgi:hypothetical protein